MEQLRKQCMAWLEQTNPLKGLSISRAGSIYDMARKFGSPRLQYTYNEIEKTDPVVYVCCDRRESALAGLEWSFIPRAHADETLAQEQADALTKFTDGIDNFSEVLSHLDGAFFRGYAHAQPIWEGGRSGRGGMSGTGAKVSHINLLDSWNFLTDPDGNWYWNPACHETPSGLDTVEGAQLVSLTRRRSIDYPILFIYIRKALGERDYGRFIERHGIPHAAIIMGPGTEEKDKAKYLAAANAWNNGQDLALPNGSDIKLATEARGTDPFTPFVEHQDKYTVLLATGATLTTLAQADTGSLAGGAHMEVWREIVARDGVKIAEELNRDLFRRYLELEFPGRPMAAKFVLSNEKKQTAEEVADLAGKLKTAGYLVDKEQLEEKVGLKLVKDETPAPGGLGQPALPFMNKQPADRPDARPSEDEQPSAILRAFAADMSPAGKAVKELLDALESGADVKAEAASLVSRLPSLLPDDPLTAATIAEAMANEFGAKIENKEDICRAQNPALCRVHGDPREHHDKGFQDQFGNGNPETLAADPKMNMERGMAVFTRLARKQTGSEPHAMYRDGLGWIGIDAGIAGNSKNDFAGGHGIAHILAKHKGAERSIAETLQHGEMFRNWDSKRQAPCERKITVIHGNNVAILSKSRGGRILITDYDVIQKHKDGPSVKEQLESLKRLGPYHVRGKNK